MSDLLNNLSGLSTVAIASAFAVHLVAFAWLWGWSKRDLRQIAGSLDEFTRGLKHRSILGATGHLSDQIEAFIADVNEVLGDPNRQSDRQALLHRMNVLDERRGYLHSMFFETTYNIWRTMIDAYPLAGVLGTILAIGVALQTTPGGEAAASLDAIVDQFGYAVWSTFAGLASAIVLMFFNSCVEPPFQRLSESRMHVREMVAHTKRELGFTAGETA
ncbi:MAG: MotA/TolQ/ExbB proton channel family protein [Planctomycetaceae bacterium]